MRLDADTAACVVIAASLPIQDADRRCRVGYALSGFRHVPLSRMLSPANPTVS